MIIRQPGNVLIQREQGGLGQDPLAHAAPASCAAVWRGR